MCFGRRAYSATDCNCLLVPQPTLQAFLLQCQLKENLKVIDVFRVLMNPSRSTGITSGFISLGIVVVLLLNCSPSCDNQIGCGLFSFIRKLNIDFSKPSSVRKFFLNKRKKSFCSLMLQHKGFDISPHLGDCCLSFPCFKKNSILLHPSSFQILRLQEKFMICYKYLPSLCCWSFFHYFVVIKNLL